FLAAGSARGLHREKAPPLCGGKNPGAEGIPGKDLQCTRRPPSRTARNPRTFHHNGGRTCHAHEKRGVDAFPVHQENGESPKRTNRTSPCSVRNHSEPGECHDERP